MPAGLGGRVQKRRVKKALRQGGVYRGVGIQAEERKGFTEAQDVYGTRVRLDRDGLTYGEEFVPFDEMGGMRSLSQSLWNPATNLFEIAVVRRNGPDLVVKNLPLQTVERLRAAIIVALSERNV